MIKGIDRIVILILRYPRRIAGGDLKDHEALGLVDRGDAGPEMLGAEMHEGAGVLVDGRDPRKRLGEALQQTVVGEPDARVVLELVDGRALHDGCSIGMRVGNEAQRCDAQGGVELHSHHRGRGVEVARSDHGREAFGKRNRTLRGRQEEHSDLVR